MVFNPKNLGLRIGIKNTSRRKIRLSLSYAHRADLLIKEVLFGLEIVPMYFLLHCYPYRELEPRLIDQVAVLDSAWLATSPPVQIGTQYLLNRYLYRVNTKNVNKRRTTN
jgi:hypothetical protein